MSIRLLLMAAAAIQPPETVGVMFYTCSSITYGNGIFVAVDGSDAFTSTDGITWNTGVLIDGHRDGGWTKIVFGNGIFSALRYSTADVATSADGVTWTVYTTFPSTQTWISTTYGNNWFLATSGTNWYIVRANDGHTYYGTNAGVVGSPPGITLPSPFFIPPLAIAYVSGSTFVTVGAGYSSVSTDNGAHWSARSAMPHSSPLSSTTPWTKLAVDYTTGLIVAVSAYVSGDYYVATSTDGLTWTLMTNTISTSSVINLSGFICENSKFIGVAALPASFICELTFSGSGAGSMTVTTLTTPVSATLNDICYGNGICVAIGNAGTTAISQIITTV